MQPRPGPSASKAWHCIAAYILLTSAAGCGPAVSPQPHSTAASSDQSPLRFRNVAATAGINAPVVHAGSSRNILETIGHGCAFLDYDGDGRLDILLVLSGGARLYHNEGSGQFRDVTAAALPMPPQQCHFLGCSVADYDTDGRPDIFLTGYGSTALYHNEGNGTFKDATRNSGLEARGPYDWTTSSAWADVDGDGKPDLFVCRYVRFTPADRQLCAVKTLDGGRVDDACAPTTYSPESGSLYRNLGGGRFQEVKPASGLVAHGNNLGCMFCDLDASGREDLYVANDVKLSDLFLNLGSFRFKNIGVEAGVAFAADGAAQSGMGVDWADYDHSGRFSLLVANYAGQPKSLYHNEGKHIFTNQTYASGVGAASQSLLAFGAAFVDVDNSGLPDIVFTNGHVQKDVDRIEGATSYFQPCQLLRNLGGGRFEDASRAAGGGFATPIVGRGIAVGDYDGDGKEDLLIVNEEGAPLLLHNESASANHWITLRCLGRNGKSDALGALITVSATGARQLAEIRSGGSYLSANAPEAHFGLGPATEADIEIRWPDGLEARYLHIAADHYYVLTEGHPQVSALKP